VKIDDIKHAYAEPLSSNVFNKLLMDNYQRIKIDANAIENYGMIYDEPYIASQCVKSMMSSRGAAEINGPINTDSINGELTITDGTIPPWQQPASSQTQPPKPVLLPHQLQSTTASSWSYSGLRQPQPVDPEAPDNPVLKRGDTARILYPHNNMWDGMTLNYPPFFAPVGIDDDDRIKLLVQHGSRFKAGQMFVYLGEPEQSTYIIITYQPKDTQLVQFLIDGRLYYMDVFAFNSLRFFKV